MGLIRRLLPLFVIISILVVPGPAFAAGSADEVIVGGEFVVGEDDVLEDDLRVLGGEVRILPGGQVNGDVTVIGGQVTIGGSVDGDVRQYGGTLELAAGAYIGGELRSSGGSLVRAEGAIVAGGYDADTGGPPGVTRDRRWMIGDFILDSYWNLFVLFAMAGLAVLVGMLWPKQMAVMGEAVAANPLMAGGVGLLTVGVVVPVLGIAALTLILIPVSLAGFLVLGAGGALGWIGLGYEVGSRIGAAAGQDWTPGIAAGVGAFFMGIVFMGVEQVPCVGWAMQAAIGLVGLGAVVMTRFGTQPGQQV